eukprot:CAMPEP_0172640202 /NCGR_PEP_ID=MMETSP1068-20121228/222020_1 /TAXON_ID=35684 /ORGANISM="Pseudopedinella elastica, Strain CCMP716" /LENGTH=49 /DNA_ID=CAMNT_0013453537 /DNA_START=226 /DNA_END=375 /DNA_ORIENTATION=-
MSPSPPSGKKQAAVVFTAMEVLTRILKGGACAAGANAVGNPGRVGQLGK